MMNLGLVDQVVTVIGAASGIGFATGKRFHDEGARVVWADRSATVHDVVKRADPDASTQSRIFQVDAVDYSAVQQLAQSVDRQFGRCDHVVVTAGVGSGKYGFPFWNLQPQDWATVIDGNLMSVVHVLHAFVPQMVPKRSGTFALLTSVAGQIGSQTDPPYSAAKAAVINFAQCAAKDLAAFGIRVNAISPGMVKTGINRSVWQSWRDASDDNTLDYEAWAEQKIKRIAPLGRWQSANEVAAVIGFLASDHAKNMTGQTINVDGGQVMRA